jgi:hypothetical protein
MLLQMIGILFFLIIVGGLATLVAVGDPHHARPTRYFGFVFLFAGIGGLLFSIGLAWLGTVLLSSQDVSGLGFFGGYAFGGLAGAALGFYRAGKHRPATESSG